MFFNLVLYALLKVKMFFFQHIWLFKAHLIFAEKGPMNCLHGPLSGFNGRKFSDIWSLIGVRQSQKEELSPIVI